MGTVDFDFAGSTVVVTGAARGIGLGIAARFARSGADTYMVDMDEEELTARATELGATPVRADVSSTSDVKALVARVVEETGRVDVLVNNAGILRDGVVWKLSDEDWDAVLAVHAGGTFRLTRACVPHFRAQGSGRIINVTSFTGLRGNIGQTNYATAKAGIIGFTKTAARELARFNVTVNAISPNAATRMVASIPEATKADILGITPLGRFAEPSEMADAVAFLASDAAVYITGVVLPVDGGLSI